MSCLLTKVKKAAALFSARSIAVQMRNRLKGSFNFTNRCSSFEAISVLQELSMSSSHSFCFGYSLVYSPLHTCNESTVSSSPDVEVAAKGNLGAATPGFNDSTHDRSGNDRII